MTTEPIDESGMRFGPYEEGYCFYIENSKLLGEINKNAKRKEGVKVAEFLLLRPRPQGFVDVLIVEAKSSTPRPETQPGFAQFVEDIRDKMVNSLTLATAACIGRHPSAQGELPEPFKALDLAAANFRFVLVINGHEKAWLPPLRDALAKSLRVAAKTWALPPTPVIVLNDAMARSEGLVGGSP